MKIIGLDTNDGLELSMLIFLGVVAIFIICIVVFFIRVSISHTCQYCHTNETTRTNDNGEYECESCADNALIKAAKRNEKIRKCPSCSRDMDKQVVDGTDIVADVCPSCGGVFLDKGELQELEEQLEIDEIIFNPATTVAMMTAISH